MSASSPDRTHHDVKPSDVKSTSVNIPQLETLRALAAEQEAEIVNARGREEKRVSEYKAIHSDIYDKISKLQSQLDVKTRNEVALTARLQKAETRINYLESLVDDIEKIGKMEERVRHLEQQIKMEAPSALQEHGTQIKTLQRQVYESDKKMHESIAHISQQINAVSAQQKGFNDSVADLRAKCKSLDDRKLERGEVEAQISALVEKQRDIKVQISSFNDTIDELSRQLKDMNEEFHNDLEAHWKRVSADFYKVNLSIGDLSTQHEKVRLQLNSLEALIETVGMMERQIEDWNIERNRLNEKVDTVLQRRLRELDKIVQKHELYKMDKEESEKKMKDLANTFVSTDKFKFLTSLLEQMESKVNIFDNNYVQLQDQVAALDTSNKRLVPTSKEHGEELKALYAKLDHLAAVADEAAKKVGEFKKPVASVVVQQAAVPSSNFSDSDIENMQKQFDSLRQQINAFADLKLQLDKLGIDFEELSLRVNNNKSNRGGGGQMDENAMEDLLRKVAHLEHVKADKDYLKKQLWALMEKLRKETDGRVDNLAVSCGTVIDQVRGDNWKLAQEVQKVRIACSPCPFLCRVRHSYAYNTLRYINFYFSTHFLSFCARIVCIQYHNTTPIKWIKQFLRYLAAAGNRAVSSTNAAASTRCLVCEREPQTYIDYANPQLAFNPVGIFDDGGTHGEGFNDTHGGEGESKRTSVQMLLSSNGRGHGGGGTVRGTSPPRDRDRSPPSHRPLNEAHFTVVRDDSNNNNNSNTVYAAAPAGGGKQWGTYTHPYTSGGGAPTHQAPSPRERPRSAGSTGAHRRIGSGFNAARK